MAFQPVIDILAVARDSSWFTVIDNTPDYNVTLQPGGWGAPGGPADSTDIVWIRLQLQYFGTSGYTLLTSSSLTGTFFSETGLKGTYKFKDGVTILQALYGMVDDGIIESISGKVITTSLTGDAFNTNYGNIGYVIPSDHQDKPYLIKSVDSSAGTITLYEDFVTDRDTMIKAYIATQRVLVLNEGKGKLLQDIQKMAITKSGCAYSVELMDRVLLQLVSQAAFNCGQYVKAHNGAVLLMGKASEFTPCTNC